MAKIMVTGATGLLGRAVVKQLKQCSDFQVIECGFSRASIGIEVLDLTQSEQVFEFVAKHKPDAIVHCAAERRPDVSEQAPQAALALNAEASDSLAKAASQNGAWLLYISTDYVFDGTAPKYEESSQTNPVNFYGQSKLQGENLVADSEPSFAILRLPILYGDVESLNESAVMVLLKHLLAPHVEYLDDWAVRSPTSTADIAVAIHEMLVLQLAGKQLSGRYHFSAEETMSKYQMLLVMAEILGLDTGHLIAVTSPTDSAKRPKDCSLSCERLASLGIKSRLPFKVGIESALLQSSVVQQWLAQR
ncbi:dTDP-4-dehydrorhamnose reductase family protein [Shewanella pealeana]|nr:SDR family oxidoreductase [Shewanella pealeana]